jgi:P-type Cu2+ transporter
MPNVVYNFIVPDVSCHTCRDTILTHIKSQLEQYPNIHFVSYDLSLIDKNLQVEVDANAHLEAQDIVDVLDMEACGFSIEALDANESPQKSQLHYWGASFGLGLGTLLMLASLGVFVFPFLFSVPALFLGSAALSALAWPFVRKAWNHLYLSLKYAKYQNIFNMDSLFAFTGCLVIASTLLSLWFPVFPVLLEAGFMIFGFRHLGCIVQFYLDDQIAPTHSLLESFKNQRFQVFGQKTPECGKYLTKEKIFLAKKGDIIPVNGCLIECSKNATLRDILKAGSYFPIHDCQTGQTVEAGTEVMDGEVWIKVTDDIMHSRLAQIDDALQDIRSRQKPAEILLKAEQWLQWFIPGLILLAIISGIWIGQVFGLAMALKCVAAILVSACPCTLGFIVPMSLQMGAYKAKLHQLHFQNGQALQLAAEAKIVVVDYNGTLTEGDYHVSDFKAVGNSVDVLQCYRIIDAVESHLLTGVRKHHPIGERVKVKTKQMLEQYGCFQIEVKDFEDYGFGAKIVTSNGEWWFGNQKILEMPGTIVNRNTIENAPQRLYLLHRPTHCQEVSYLGHLNIQDHLRHNAKWFIDNLRQQDKKIRICTGADQITAQRISELLNVGMEDIRAEQRPQDKASFIQELRDNYPDETIAMIGDGANDCEALAESDIKIWLKNQNHSQGFEEFMKSCANMVVTSCDLLGVSQGFEIANQTFLAIEQNLWISFAYNIVMLSLACGSLLALGFAMHPAIGACMMILQSMCLVWNNYRISQLPLENLSTLAADF